ncbi:MAG: chemotaxis protein CheB [bacterium]
MKIIITEDNHELREIIKNRLSQESYIDIIGIAQDIFSLKSLIMSEKPEVLIIDIELIGLDGMEFLRRFIQQENIAVIAITSQTQKGKHLALQTLELGVLDFVIKPPTDIQKGIESMLSELTIKLKSVPKAKIKNLNVDNQFGNARKPEAIIKDEQILKNKIIVIGSSTGSIPFLKKFLTQLPPEIPGMIVITDLPAGFTKTFADRLNEISKVKIREAVNKDNFKPGRVLIAPGDLHTKVFKIGNRFEVVVENGEKINGQRPSIDVLMHSVAEQAPNLTIGVLLSGNIADGIHGFLEMKRAGSKNILVDKTNLVFDELVSSASELRAADFTVKPDMLIDKILELV